jgi:hypothetical protein
MEHDEENGLIDEKEIDFTLDELQNIDERRKKRARYKFGHVIQFQQITTETKNSTKFLLAAHN